MAATGIYYKSGLKFSCYSRNYVHFVLFLLITTAIHGSVYSQSWNFVKEKEGIKIYTRLEKDNSLKTFRGEANIHASSEEIYAIIGNAKSAIRWDADIREFRILSSEKDKSFSYYLIYKIPWPLQDRDLCAGVKISRDTVTGEVIIFAKSILNSVPEDKNLVRIRDYWQKWTIHPIDRNHTLLILEGFANPTGNIPGWLYNMVITETPLKMLRQIRQWVQH
jgi:hypothetical protein